jgi:hypothetical protein
MHPKLSSHVIPVNRFLRWASLLSQFICSVVHEFLLRKYVSSVCCLRRYCMMSALKPLCRTASSKSSLDLIRNLFRGYLLGSPFAKHIILFLGPLMVPTLTRLPAVNLSRLEYFVHLGLSLSRIIESKYLTISLSWFLSSSLALLL